MLSLGVLEMLSLGVLEMLAPSTLMVRVSSRSCGADSTGPDASVQPLQGRGLQQGGGRNGPSEPSHIVHSPSILTLSLAMTQSLVTPPLS